MKHRSRPPELDDFLRPRLVDMIVSRHELVKLAALIDWKLFDQEWLGFFPSTTGSPTTPPRLVAGLSRSPLKGTVDGPVCAVLCACGHNIRKILAHLRASFV